MDVQLQYSAEQDRIRLLLPRAGSDHIWWLTRRLTLALLPGVVQKLAAVPLPPAPATSWAPSPGGLPIAEQHNLLMEYDGPRSDPAPAAPAPVVVEASAGPDDERTERLVMAAHLKLSANACVLRLEARDGSVPLNLNRQQVHSFLEALARLCRTAGWVGEAHLPGWLGVPERPDEQPAPPKAG